MVYPKNWKLEDKFSTGKTLEVFGLSLVFLHLVSRIDITTVYVMEIVYSRYALTQIWSYMSFTFVFERQSFEFGTCDILHESSAMSFWMMLYHLSCLSLIVFWSRM